MSRATSASPPPRGTARWPSAPSRWAAARPARRPSGRSGRAAAGLRGAGLASGMTRWPPPTSVSLLAVATTLPASSAARTGRRLTTPPVATTTRSTSSRVAIASIASGPVVRNVPGRQLEPRGRRRIGQRHDPRRSRRTWVAKRLGVAAGGHGHDLEGGVARGGQDVQRLAPDGAGRTGEQGDPRRPVASPRAAPRHHDEQVEVDDGRGEEDRVDPVEHAAVAGDERARVLGAGRPLEQRLGQVAGLARDRDQRAQGDGAGGAGPASQASAPSPRWPRRCRR